MTIQERLLSGKANVVFNPAHNEASGEYEIALLIDGDYIDSFPTYTSASNHLIYLIEE